ncbi:MAG: lipopolysaccharide biosynthesis protein [Prevotella sp.]|nr:lipopolysaccharide biosynthesis protein [Prevotella sp.]
MSEKSLKQKATAGMLWTALSKYSTTGITFVSGIILARLLTPHDYGCIGLLGIFMSLASTFIGAGFGTALIQKKSPTQTDYSTIFFWNMGMAVVMYVILFFSAPAVAAFYRIPLLCPVLRVQAFVLVINAFNLVQRSQLRKQLKFSVLSKVSIATSFLSLAVTIIMAYQGFGVWSLVTQNLLAAAIPALVFWFYVRWRPLLIFSWKSFRELFSFGAYILLSNIVNTFGSELQGLLIGKLFNASTLGYYSKAVGAEQMASYSISGVITSVSFPLYAEAQDDKVVLGNIIRRLTMTISYLTFPFMLLLMTLGKPLFVLLYSERWLPSVIYFQVLCLVGISSCLQAVNTQSIAAIGKSKQMFSWILVKRVLGACAMIIGLVLYGMKGFLVGVVLYNYFCYFVNIGLVSKYIGYKWNKQLKDLMPVALVSLVALAVCNVCVLFHLNMYVEGAIKLLIFLFVYMGWSLIFKPEAYTYTLTLIPERFKFWKRNPQ